MRRDSTLFTKQAFLTHTPFFTLRTVGWPRECLLQHIAILILPSASTPTPKSPLLHLCLQLKNPTLLTRGPLERTKREQCQRRTPTDLAPLITHPIPIAKQQSCHLLLVHLPLAPQPQAPPPPQPPSRLPPSIATDNTPISTPSWRS